MSFSQLENKALKELGLKDGVIDELGRGCCSSLSLFKIGKDGFAPHYKTFPEGPSIEEIQEEIHLLSAKSKQYPELADFLEKQCRTLTVNYLQSDEEKLYKQLRWANISDECDIKLRKYADLIVKHLRASESVKQAARGKGFLELAVTEETEKTLDSEIMRLESLLAEEQAKDASGEIVRGFGFRHFSTKRRSYAFNRLLEIRRLLELDGYLVFAAKGPVVGESFEFESEEKALDFVNMLRKERMPVEDVLPEFREATRYSYRTTEELINYPSAFRPKDSLEKLDDGSWIVTENSKYAVKICTFAVVLMKGIMECEIPLVMGCSAAPQQLSRLLVEIEKELPFEVLECDRRTLCLGLPIDFTQISEMRIRFQKALGNMETLSVNFDYDEVAVADRKIMRVDFFR